MSLKRKSFERKRKWFLTFYSPLKLILYSPEMVDAFWVF